MNPQTPFLDPAELYSRRRSKDAARLKAYNKILEQIYHKIRVLSQTQNAPCYMTYTIPHVIIGLPLIDQVDCATYLIYQLRHASYEVRYTAPNLIYISWQHHERSYLVEQSPIMLAMMESAERTQAEIERKEKEASRLLAPKRSNRKVRIQAPGSFQRQAAMPSSSGSMGGGLNPRSGLIGVNPNAIRTVLQNPPAVGPPPPSAAAYVPPPSFLQNMNQPPSNASQPKAVTDYFNLS
jgi:hypothetical protein